MLEIVASYHCMQFQQKLMIQTQENGGKLHFEPDLGPLGLVKFALRIYFFLEIWLRQSLDIMVSYHHVQYQKKLMIQSWENLVTDGQTDRQMDESDFIGRCPTNVERPTRNFLSIGYWNLAHIKVLMDSFNSHS